MRHIRRCESVIRLAGAGAKMILPHNSACRMTREQSRRLLRWNPADSVSGKLYRNQQTSSLTSTMARTNLSACLKAGARPGDPRLGKVESTGIDLSAKGCSRQRGLSTRKTQEITRWLPLFFT